MNLERAIGIAVSAHKGQVDKAGYPYILHPLRVMFACRSDDERIVGVLHDVIEDTPWTPDDLRAEGASEGILGALDAVTRRETETYPEFISRAGKDPVATSVKIADLHDNLDLSRIANPTEADHARMARYRTALKQLEGQPTDQTDSEVG